MSRLALLLIPAFVIGCSSPDMKPPPMEPAQVTVEPVVERTLDSFMEFTGYLKPVETQEIRAQVTGYIKEIKFNDGDTVNEGTELFLIDPEPYDAALQSAKGALEKSKADITNTETTLVKTQAEYERGQRLAQSKSLSAEELDVRRASRDAAAADVLSKKANLLTAEADVRKAEFDRKNCVVKSDVKGAGRVSRTLLTKGNLVASGQTMLCKITSVDPIHVYWDVDETTSLRYRKQIYDKKELDDPRKTPLACWVGLKDEDGFPHKGKVDYLAPEIIRGSGSREVRGLLDNADSRLSPGDSVRVKVEFGQPRKYLTIPEIAIGSRQNQKYVYVIVKKDNQDTVEQRVVTIGNAREIGGARQVSIESGLKVGELVVVNGLLRIREGVPVKYKLQEPVTTPPLTDSK